MKYKFEVIGRANESVEGSDEYILITDNCEELNLNEVESWLAGVTYRTCDRPGGYFCHAVTVVPKPNRPHECIGIIHHRYDV